MKKFTATSLIIVSALLVFGVAQAQQNIVGGLNNSPGASLTIDRVYTIILTLACWLAQIAITIIVIALIFYAFMFFRAQGDPQAFSSAKTAFGWGLIGALVILGAYTIIASVAAFLDPSGLYLDYTIILKPFTNCSTLISQIP